MEKMPDNEAIKKHNIDEMNSSMLKLLSSESIGGNAGTVKIEGNQYFAAGANGYIDGQTGKIMVFGNIQNLDKEIVSKNVSFTIKVAMGIRGGKAFYKITDIAIDSGVSDQAKKNLKSSISEWNKQYEKNTTAKKRQRKIEKVKFIQLPEIASSQSFEELALGIHRLKEIEGSKKIYKAKELIEIIDKVRKGELPLTNITNSQGIRQKVKDLIKIEKLKKDLGKAA